MLLWQGLNLLFMYLPLAAIMCIVDLMKRDSEIKGGRMQWT